MRPSPPIDWAHVVATALCLAVLGAIALGVTSYEPKPLSARASAASRARNFANCGSGMFGASQQEQQCPRLDVISLQREPCAARGCEAFDLTVHADGHAVLDVTAPPSAAGRFEARVDRIEFRQLAILVASLQFERVGSVVPPSTEAGGYRLRAGCGGHWTVDVNEGGKPGDIEAVERCLLDMKQRADWLEASPAADAQ